MYGWLYYLIDISEFVSCSHWTAVVMAPRRVRAATD